MIREESFGIVPFSHEGGVWKVLLILHKGGNHWGFPKGKANPGETSLESATRELKEETGLIVEKVLLDYPLVEQYQFHRKKKIVVKGVYYFPALVTGALILQEEEIRDAKWMLLSEVPEQLSFREARHVFQECMRSLKL